MINVGVFTKVAIDNEQRVLTLQPAYTVPNRFFFIEGKQFKSVKCKETSWDIGDLKVEISPVDQWEWVKIGGGIGE